MVNSKPLLYWIDEREKIRRKREEQQPPPWTDDPILQQYRFCNVRRRDDRVTRWIYDSIIDPYRDHPNLWIMLALARYINWPDTLLELMDLELWPTGERPDWRRIGTAIDDRAGRDLQTWTGAYMIRAESNPKAEWYGWGKGRYVAEIVLNRELWKPRTVILNAIKRNSVQAAHTAIAGRYGWGSFMAGQVVADYTYCSLLETAPDLYSWAPLGPGSRRGLNRLHGRDTNAPLTQEQAVNEMNALAFDIQMELGLTLVLHDVQNCLCEVDKYLRVQLGEGRPRSHFTPPPVEETPTC